MAIDTFFWAARKHRQALEGALADDRRAIKARKRQLERTTAPPKPRKKRKGEVKPLSFVGITHKLITVPLAKNDAAGNPIIDKEGNEVVSFFDLGVRFDLGPGEWWFHHWKHGSWSHHKEGPPLRYRSGSPVTDIGGKVLREPERVTHYKSDSDLMQRMSHCLSLVIALFRERELAEEELENRRM